MTQSIFSQVLMPDKGSLRTRFPCFFTAWLDARHLVSDPSNTCLHQHQKECRAYRCQTCQPPRIAPQRLAVSFHYYTRFIKRFLWCDCRRLAVFRACSTSARCWFKTSTGYSFSWCAAALISLGRAGVDVRAWVHLPHQPIAIISYFSYYTKKYK